MVFKCSPTELLYSSEIKQKMLNKTAYSHNRSRLSDVEIHKTTARWHSNTIDGSSRASAFDAINESRESKTIINMSPSDPTSDRDRKLTLTGILKCFNA